MKSKAQSAYEKVQNRLLMAPGMIEESERRLLFKAAFNCRSLPAVEFGAFFGASTLALACGLSSGQTNTAPLTCIDAFEVEADHSFHKHVISYAKHCKAEKLLQIDGTKTNWMKITKAVLGSEAKNVRLIKGIVDNNFDMTLLPETIGLLHLDLPKDAKTIRPILQGAFPKLTRGSIVAFQDYAYQFSNELIAFFQLLEEENIAEMQSIAASSAFFILTTNDPSQIRWEYLLDKALEDETNLIHRALKKYANLNSSRESENIAIIGALIRKLTSEAQITLEKQKHIQNWISKMININENRAALVLSEILTEKFTPHK